MFTGLINFTGAIADRRGSVLHIEVPAELRAQLQHGDSVAVNGVCLTAARLMDHGIEADLLPATLMHTTLGRLAVGAAVNLEPALRAGDPLGGHLVQGHVDGTTTLRSAERGDDGTARYTFELPAWLSHWIVPKGSICVDGVSLTVQELGADSFSVQLIPLTLELTSLGRLEAGAEVNLEADLIVKTVSELLRRNVES